MTWYRLNYSDPNTLRAEGRAGLSYAVTFTSLGWHLQIKSVRASDSILLDGFYSSEAVAKEIAERYEYGALHVN